MDTHRLKMHFCFWDRSPGQYSMPVISINIKISPTLRKTAILFPLTNGTEGAIENLGPLELGKHAFLDVWFNIINYRKRLLYLPFSFSSTLHNNAIICSLPCVCSTHHETSCFLPENAWDIFVLFFLCFFDQRPLHFLCACFCSAPGNTVWLDEL